MVFVLLLLLSVQQAQSHQTNILINSSSLMVLIQIILE